jgi:hypothetical protein
VISDWGRILIVVTEVAGARALKSSVLRGRPSLRLSLFWGPRWNEYLGAGNSPARLRPADADQHGRFYPAWHGRPAAIDLPWAGQWPRLVSQRALRILARFGVPVRLA